MTTVRVYRSGARGGPERWLSQEDFYDCQGRKTEGMKGVGPCGGGYLTSRTVFMLEERGLITEAAIYTHDNILISREGQAREFDTRGNWVKETRSRWNVETDSFEPFETREWVITYY